MNYYGSLCLPFFSFFLLIIFLPLLEGEESTKYYTKLFNMANER